MYISTHNEDLRGIDFIEEEVSCEEYYDEAEEAYLSSLIDDPAEFDYYLSCLGL